MLFSDLESWDKTSFQLACRISIADLSTLASMIALTSTLVRADRGDNNPLGRLSTLQINMANQHGKMNALRPRTLALKFITSNTYILN